MVCKSINDDRDSLKRKKIRIYRQINIDLGFHFLELTVPEKENTEPL